VPTASVVADAPESQRETNFINTETGNLQAIAYPERFITRQTDSP